MSGMRGTSLYLSLVLLRLPLVPLWLLSSAVSVLVCWERRSFSRPRMTYSYLFFSSFFLLLSDFLCVAPG